MRKKITLGLVLFGLTSFTTTGTTLRFDLNISDSVGFSGTARYTLDVQEWSSPIVDNTGTPITQWSFPVLSGSVDFAGETTFFSPVTLSGSVFQATFDGFGSLQLSNDNLPFPSSNLGGLPPTGGTLRIFNQVFTEGVSMIPVERNSTDLRYLDPNELPDNRGTSLNMIEDAGGTPQENLVIEISNVSIPEHSSTLLIALTALAMSFHRCK